jgi:hypothetical protein
MKWKFVIKNREFTLGFYYAKQKQSNCFLAKYEYCKQAQQVGALEIYKTKTIGLQYQKFRLKMLTQQHKIIKKRTE